MNEEPRLPVPNGASPFERIRRTNSAGAEYWSSRNFAQVLGYSDYRNFEQVIKKAKTACFNSGHRIEDHFVDITEMIEIRTTAKISLAEGVGELQCWRRRHSKLLIHAPSKMDIARDSNEQAGTESV